MSPVELTWLGCDLRSGAVAEELRSLRPTQALSRRLGAGTSSSLDLALDGAPPDWEAATDPGRTMLVAVDTATGVPVWTGLPKPRAGGSGPVVQLAAATPECYLDGRYPGDYTATATDQVAVMAAVAAPALTGGPPVVLDTTASGTLIDYAVADADDRTILSYLQEIAAMRDGPEWTVDTVWADAAQTRVQLVLRIRPTIGVVSPSPEAVFDMPGSVADYVLTESYERGRGATSVIARGDRADGVRATSSTHTATDLISSGWPLWESRFSPAQGVTDTSQLERHAAEALALMGTGSKSWTLTAVASRAPRVGSDWGLGDSVRLAVAASPRHPAGVEVVARAYAWELNPSTDRVSPILLEDQ
ncbi:hypothetical protein ACIQOW_03745 [Kitasatospora sp. NPDC091335]|uniref:hypothetical protein n=1 Tax=Kitasatospora sp. NPDC091335 TaxID=3364085 RepID=UPI00381D97F3